MMKRPKRQQVDPAMTQIPEGTSVIVRKDDGSDFPTKTRSKPWQLGHGDWVVSVEGIAGGYALGRVRLAPERPTPVLTIPEAVNHLPKRPGVVVVRHP